MKTGIVEFRYFEKGDHVMTPLGVGVVAENEKPILDEEDLVDSDVIVQHKFNCSENTENRTINMARHSLVRITEKEYVEDKEYNG